MIKGLAAPESLHCTFQKGKECPAVLKPWLQSQAAEKNASKYTWWKEKSNSESLEIKTS